MDFTILRIGEATPLENRTIVMQYGQNIDTEVGEVVVSRIARVVVRDASFTKAVGDHVTLDMDDTFKFEDRPYTIPEGEENAGDVVNLTWIVKA